MTTERPRPEDFLELVERAKRGRLKLYIGFAAGVGKTYRMLEEAHALRKRGVDVVIGLVETHGRAETATLLDGLEIVPTRRVGYRGLAVEEMDLDAVLARRAQVAIVDEIAHTNAPNSRHPKRYQDVLAILDAGINVICAFNVQHLESLKDVVERVTGVVIRETVPDTFLKQADQIVNIDLDVDDLLDRLRAGKIYAPEKVAWALDHFFKPNHLLSLRELALREVAETVERAVSGLVTSRDADHNPRPNARVMVCVASSSPHAQVLLRRGSRFAGRLNTDWYVVYVETPREAPTLIDSEAQRRLLATIDKARELGAEVVKLRSRDPVSALLDFARGNGVGYIMIGRGRQPWWRRLLRSSAMDRFVHEAEGFDVHIVSFPDEERHP
ncbi:MAG TPA: universal stress protein [Pirellulales bacterium]|nr:universal stress protein [Pirellulales bacterium]